MFSFKKLSKAGWGFKKKKEQFRGEFDVRQVEFEGS